MDPGYSQGGMVCPCEILRFVLNTVAALVMRLQCGRDIREIRALSQGFSINQG